MAASASATVACGRSATCSVVISPPALFSGCANSSCTSSRSSFVIRRKISLRLTGDSSATASAASSGLISSNRSAARSGSKSSSRSVRVSGSNSSSASAATSSSRVLKMSARSRGVSWSTMVARSAGCSSERPACGTRSRTLAMVEPSGSTSSQSMYEATRDCSPERRLIQESGRPSRRSSPAVPTSTATRRIAPSTKSRITSLARTTLRPSMSTICLSSRSPLRRISSSRRRKRLMLTRVAKIVAPAASIRSTLSQPR